MAASEAGSWRRGGRRSSSGAADDRSPAVVYRGRHSRGGGPDGARARWDVLEFLDRLQPKSEYLQALRESVLEVWKKRQSEVDEFKEIRQKRKARIEERKQRLIEAFVYQQALDPETYRREMDRIRDDEVVTDVELHENRMDELDVEGVLAFAEHVVLNARRLRSEYDLKRRRHLPKALFPSGVHFDGEGFGTPLT